MPYFCGECGADTYICQVCRRILCSEENPSKWKPDLTGYKSAGNICPRCLSIKEPKFPKVRILLESKGWKDCFLSASFKKGNSKVMYSYISDLILDGKTAEEIYQEIIGK